MLLLGLELPHSMCSHIYCHAGASAVSTPQPVATATAYLYCVVWQVAMHLLVLQEVALPRVVEAKSTTASLKLSVPWEFGVVSWQVDQ